MEMEMEMERKGVLIVATPYLLLAIDPTRLSISPVENLESDMPLPPVFNARNLLEEGFPYGMRFFVRDSKLHMVGGEKLLQGIPMENLYRRLTSFVDKSFGTDGASPYIYVADLTTADSVTELSKLPMTMISPKPDPYIAEVEGKIYVLYGRPEYYPVDKLLFPTFEVYDPHGGKWEALPDPPFYNRERSIYDPIDRVHGIYTAKTTIFVKAGKDDYSYDVRTRIWDHLGSSVRIPPLLQPMSIGFQPGQYVPDYDDVFIGLRSHTLFAALIPHDGSPPTYQVLDEVFDEYKKQHVRSFSGAVIAMGEKGKEMCVIKGGFWEDLQSTAYIATFRVEKLHSSAQGRSSSPAPERVKTTAASEPLQDSEPPPAPRFLSVTCSRKGFYKLDAWGIGMPTISGAFFQPWE